MYKYGGIFVLFVVSLGTIEAGLEFGQSCLWAHNGFRRLHQLTRDLAYNEDLAKSAQEYADYLSSTGKYEPSRMVSEGTYSENILKWPDYAVMYNKNATCRHAIDQWYNEILFYSYSTTKSTSKDHTIGHFVTVCMFEL
ncbi:unnamed protein product [Owenia fusiformis]|uniref:Uncharacterized protein n=1 Tax=Owenia fusiformis TaxID=6347 RepID=A0A8J1UXR6_OWEFU|nr:unnamed protein product [Owenia fusiformis]